MKNNKLFLSLSLIVLVGALVNFYLTQEKKEYVPRNIIKVVNEEGIDGAINWLNNRRLNQNTHSIDVNDIVNAQNQLKNIENLKSTNSINLEWTELGPDNVGGRTRAILIDKDNTAIIYAGAVSGGIWKSTNGGQSWVNILPDQSSLAVVSICQAANGDIYIGTGEGITMNSIAYSGAGGSDAIGQGIWKSTDAGATWTHLTSTIDATFSTSSPWVAVNKLKADPTNANRIYAGTQFGLWITNDGGATWENAVDNVYAYKQVTSISVGSDGSVIASIGKKGYWSANGNALSYQSVTGAAGQIPSSVGRLEFSIAPSDPNYIYCLAASSGGGLQNLYKSTDKGQTWTGIFSNTSSDVLNFFGDNNQGWYDNTIEVFPNDKDKVIIGGVDLYTWSANEGISQITVWWANEWTPAYVHADIHTVVFSPKYANGDYTGYIGCDGGVFRTLDAFNTFHEMDKNYNVTQFYSVAYSGNGRVMGGAQDNGTQYIDFTGNTAQSAFKVSGGDGAYCEISNLDPDILFATVYSGACYRSEKRGNAGSLESFFDNDLLGAQNIGSMSGEPFITPIALWESFNDQYSNQYIEKVVDTIYILDYNGDTISKSFPYNVGDVVTVKSNIYERPLYHTITSSEGPYQVGDTIKIKDTYQAALAIALHGQVWITREPLDFTKQPAEWSPIIPSNINFGMGNTLAWSKDGNYLYFADNSGLYRCSGLLQARDSLTMDINSDSCKIETKKIASFSQAITGIAVDPEVPSNVIITLGNYGNTDYIQYSTNATSANPTFESKQGNLPQFPVFTAIINWKDSRQVIVGTEFGTFATDNILASSPTWTSQNNGMPNVPVFMIRQQTNTNFWYDGNNGVSNHGYIYAGTHGRGIFRSKSEMGPVAIKENKENNEKNITSLKVYPNPVSTNANVEYNLKRTSDVKINIYDLTGKLISSEQLNNQVPGKHNYNFNVSSYNKGTYILSITSNGKKSISRFIVY